MSEYDGVKGFLEVLETREDGNLIPEMDAEIRKLVELCTARGGAGTLQLTIKIQKEDKYQEPVFLIQHALVVKPPAKPRRAGFLFADGDGNLTKYKPTQQVLDGMEPKGRKVIPFDEKQEEDT